MSKLSDYGKALLAGGLPAVLDYGTKAGAKQGDTKPETTAPTATIKDVDTSAPRETSIVGHITPKEIAIGVAGLLVVSAVLVLSFRALGKK